MEEILKLFGGAENVWEAIKGNAEKIGIDATRTMLELFYVMKSPETSLLNKSLIVIALGYQLLPEDAMPRDKFGLLGLLDNGVTLAYAYNRVKSSVTPEIEQQVCHILTKWFGTELETRQTSIPNTDNPIGNYSTKALFSETESNNFYPSREGLQDPYSTPPIHRPTWNDDEDVVID